MAYQPDVREVVRSRALLSDRRFRSLWLSQGIAQTAQNAILFSLLVVILGITGSSIHTSLLILAFILPSIPMGFVVGVVLDRTNKGPVLVVTNLLRAGGCILFFFFHGNEWIIYGISMGFATAGLFFNPAVVALIPSLVSRERLVPANSLYNFTLTASQLVGIVFVAPLILKSAGADGMFIAGAVLFALAAALAARLHIAHEEREPRLPQGAIFGGIPTDFRESWRVLLSDRYSFLALAQLIMSSTLVLFFAILIPRYMRDVIEVAPDSAAFVFAPTGIGALVGLRFLPWFTKKGKNRVVVIGLLGIAACLVLLALVEPLADLLKQAPEPINPTRFLRISLLQALTMAIAGPMGFAYALLNAPAQTVLHERAPPEMRGRIFATQVVSANFISLLPLLIIGAATDWLNVPVVLVLVAAVTAAMAVVSAVVAGKEPDEEPERAPQEVGT
ncbi:MAG: MFS transporter [Dehalococcoidia bacterium]|nr:MFS transporter [Dehalococcoidia bacterium]